jgi:2-dehydropantoate 2-reductase
VRVAVVGAGAVGGYFGGRLAEAGEDVTFLARGATLRALRERGLRVDSTLGDFTIHPAAAVDDPTAIGAVDAVLVTTKAWQLPDAARSIPSLVGPETAVVPLLNGVEAPDVLTEVLGPDPVLGGLCRIFARQEEPGHILHTGFQPTVDFGELDGRITPRVERLREAFQAVRGVEANVHPDVVAAMWTKLLFISPVSAVGAVTRQPIGVTRAVPETRALLEGGMREVEAVARARGVAMPDGAAGMVMGFVDGLPPEETTSLQRDVIEARPSELEAQAGAVVRLGREAGVATPVHDVLYAALLPQERAARGGSGPSA